MVYKKKENHILIWGKGLSPLSISRVSFHSFLFLKYTSAFFFFFFCSAAPDSDCCRGGDCKTTMRRFTTDTLSLEDGLGSQTSLPAPAYLLFCLTSVQNILQTRGTSNSDTLYPRRLLQLSVKKVINVFFRFLPKSHRNLPGKGLPHITVIT